MKITPELEAVARAIYDDMNKSFGKGSYLAGSLSKEPYAIQDAYLSLARAALSAIRDPTEGMVDASIDSDGPRASYSAIIAAARHTAVIDYILGGE